jgi:glycosyltransferase involved in cell wall biosynthesis
LTFSNHDLFDLDFDGFVFYSIFEWTDRKNPQALIRAFNNAFTNNENVALFIKSYFNDFSEKSKSYILSEIKNIQSEFEYKNKIFFHHELMTYDQIHSIHRSFDCYVSSHRGEGWGVPQAEAMSHGNPIITTGYGGINEYIETMNTGIVIPYKMVPIHGMDHARHYYSNDQMWAELDVDELSEKMKFVYYNQPFARKMGKNGRKYAEQTFSYKSVGSMMRDRIEEILKEIK